MNIKMPCPSRNARFTVSAHRERDGPSSTKPSCIVGVELCRGRPFLGRAAFRSIQDQTESLPAFAVLRVRMLRTARSTSRGTPISRLASRKPPTGKLAFPGFIGSISWEANCQAGNYFISSGGLAAGEDEAAAASAPRGAASPASRWRRVSPIS